MTAARTFVEVHYPDCIAAVLCGSVARNEATPHSDLDMLIVAYQEIPFYRKAFRAYGWFIEAFVGTPAFHEEKIQRSHANHSPAFLTSWAEGMILKDNDTFALRLKDKAQGIFAHGPDPLPQSEMDRYRYVITDWLDDLLDATSNQERLFIVYDLVAKTAELLLASKHQWIGERK